MEQQVGRGRERAAGDAGAIEGQPPFLLLRDRVPCDEEGALLLAAAGADDLRRTTHGGRWSVAPFLRSQGSRLVRATRRLANLHQQLVAADYCVDMFARRVVAIGREGGIRTL